MAAQYQAAWSYYNMHDEASAASEFERFLADYPKSRLVPDVRFWFAEYYMSKAMYDKAREYLSSILRDFPSSDIIIDTLYQMALSFLEEGRLRDAEAYFGETASRFAGSAIARDAHRKIALIKRKAEDYGSAIRSLRAALTADNSELNAQIQFEIAECEEAGGDLQRAAEEYLKVPAAYPKGTFWSLRARLKCAEIFEKLGKFDDAVKLYNELADMGITESEFAKKRLKWLEERKSNRSISGG
jgi:TolA-binding protein